MDLQQRIDRFLDGGPHAVVGASRDREKYGNKVLRAFVQSDRAVYAVNRSSGQVESVSTVSRLNELPEPVHGVSIITPPSITETVIQQAIELGIQHIWIQPGAENATAIKQAADAGINVIAGGPCILVALRFSE